jgi:hypothetical protein
VAGCVDRWDPEARQSAGVGTAVESVAPVWSSPFAAAAGSAGTAEWVTESADESIRRRGCCQWEHGVGKCQGAGDSCF